MIDEILDAALSVMKDLGMWHLEIGPYLGAQCASGYMGFTDNNYLYCRVYVEDGKYVLSAIAGRSMLDEFELSDPDCLQLLKERISLYIKKYV